MNCDCTAGTMCLDKNISPRSQSFPRLFSRQSDFFFFLLNFFFFFFCPPFFGSSLALICVICFLCEKIWWKIVWCITWDDVGSDVLWHSHQHSGRSLWVSFGFLGQSQLLQWHLGACDGLESTRRNWCTTESADFTFDIFINLILEASLAENRNSNSICVVLDCN